MNVWQGEWNPQYDLLQRKKVDNAKVAGNGAESQEHGPLFVEQEYKQGIRIIEANGNYEERLYKSDIQNSILWVVGLMMHQHREKS